MCVCVLLLVFIPFFFRLFLPISRVFLFIHTEGEWFCFLNLSFRFLSIHFVNRQSLSVVMNRILSNTSRDSIDIDETIQATPTTTTIAQHLKYLTIFLCIYLFANLFSLYSSYTNEGTSCFKLLQICSFSPVLLLSSALIWANVVNWSRSLNWNSNVVFVKAMSETELKR